MCISQVTDGFTVPVRTSGSLSHTATQRAPGELLVVYLFECGYSMGGGKGVGQRHVF